MKELREENQIITNINKNLLNEVNQLKLKIDDLEQKSYENMIEISRILFLNNEDCKSIAQDVSNKLNITVQVEKAFRIPTKSNQQTKILVHLKNKDMKLNLISSLRKNRYNLVNKNCSNTSQIYINERLTKVRKHLLYKTKEAAKQKS